MKKPEHSLVITREIEAPSRDVYAAWTEPEKMEPWLGKVTAEVRVGGRYRFETPTDEGKCHVFTGEYLALEEGRRVVQSFLAGEPDPDTPNPYPNEFIDVQLDDLGPSRTRLTFTNGWDGEAIDEEGLAGARAGWSAWFDMMERSLLDGERDADSGR